MQVIDYNTLESVFLITSTLILIGGMMFQSSSMSPGSTAYLFLTACLVVMIATSVVTFGCLLVHEAIRSLRFGRRFAAAAKATRQRARAASTDSAGDSTLGSPRPPTGVLSNARTVTTQRVAMAPRATTSAEVATSGGYLSDCGEAASPVVISGRNPLFRPRSIGGSMDGVNGDASPDRSSPFDPTDNPEALVEWKRNPLLASPKSLQPSPPAFSPAPSPPTGWVRTTTPPPRLVPQTLGAAVARASAPQQRRARRRSSASSAVRHIGLGSGTARLQRVRSFGTCSRGELVADS